MLRRHAALNRAARVIKILLAGYCQSLAGILLKSALAAGDRSYPKVRTAFNKIQQHLLVVAAQAKHAIRILALKFQYQVNTPGSVRAAIDEVAQKHECVGGFITRQHVEQAIDRKSTRLNSSHT